VIFVAKRAGRYAVLAAIIFLFDIIGGSPAVGQTTGRPLAKTIAWGVVTERNQKTIEAQSQDFVRYLAKKLSSSSKIEGKVVLTPTPSRLAGLLTERKVDFYMDSPRPTYMINQVYGAGKLLLRSWKGGLADYHSAIFTRRGGEIENLQDLRGKIIAFEDPESTSGFFLPRLFLTNKGLKLSPKAQIDAKVSREEVGYIFAQSQRKLVDLVLTKRVAAGAFSNDDYDSLDRNKKSEITILAETPSLPRYLVSVRKTLDPALAKALETILLSMHEDPEGRPILVKIDTTKFEILPGGESEINQRLLDLYYSPQKK
jgi:phosphonate transport system substrate-binding protein